MPAKPRSVSLVVAALVSLTTLASQAATISYWQMNGTAGNAATSVVDSVGGYNGTGAGSGGGPAPVYSSVSLPGQVFDPVAGTVVNSAGGSIFFDNTGGVNSSFGSVVTVTNTSALQLQTFTVEGFFQVTTPINFASLIGFTHSGSNPSWEIDLNSNSTLRVRADHANPFGSGAGHNQGFASSTTIANDLWHHFAVTFTPGNGTTIAGKFDLYLNYTRVGGGNLSGGEIYNLIYNTGGTINIGNLNGGRAFEGYLTDFRISDQILTTGQFLQVIPEPSRASLVLLGLGLLVTGRRRRK